MKGQSHFRQVILVAGLIVLGVGCDGGAEQRGARDAVQEFAEIAKVKVTKAGVIYLDGRKVTIDELKQEFSRLKQANGAVWYYREDPQGEPPAQAMAVIEAIVEAQLPVRLVEKGFD